jgi:serine/threonine-protein kinase HipA
MTLTVSIQRNGSFVNVGTIEIIGENNGCMTYSEQWLSDPQSVPLSLSLPLFRASFHSALMRPYFDGLLPEQDARKAVAERLGISEHSYLHLLQVLGNECIGALLLRPGDNEDSTDLSLEPSYRKLETDELAALSRRAYPVAADMVVRSRLSLAGSQAKVGLYQPPGVNEHWYLPQTSAPSTHIIKPASNRFPELVFNEGLCLLAAKKCGLDVPETRIISSDLPMLAITRFDRLWPQDDAITLADGHPLPLRLHQEDLCQALGLLPSNKYETKSDRYLDRAAKLLRGYSSKPLSDLLAFWKSVVFNFLVGNCDNHLKNLALLRSADLQSICLAPSYDIVCTTIYPELSCIMGLHIGEKTDILSVGRDDFVELARLLAINRQEAMNSLDALADEFSTAMQESIDELVRQGHTEAERIGSQILANARTRQKAIGH